MPVAVVMIDDFQVRSDAGYGYDDYGPEKALVLGYIRAAISAHQLQAYYPSTPSVAESGSRRGCVVLAKGSSHGSVLASTSFLRLAAMNRLERDATMRQASKRIPESAEKTVRDIRRATRRHHSAEEKIRIVLEGLRGEVSTAELGRGSADRDVPSGHITELNAVKTAVDQVPQKYQISIYCLTPFLYLTTHQPQFRGRRACDLEHGFLAMDIVLMDSWLLYRRRW